MSARGRFTRGAWPMADPVVRLGAWLECDLLARGYHAQRHRGLGQRHAGGGGVDVAAAGVDRAVRDHAGRAVRREIALGELEERAG